LTILKSAIRNPQSAIQRATPNLFSSPAINRLMFSECLKMITAETAHRAVIIGAKSPTGSIHVCVSNIQRGRNAAAMIEPSET
jgi:hypothetical protein